VFVQRMVRRFALGIALLSIIQVSAQSALDFSGEYAEGFDSLGLEGTTLLDGWSAVRAAGSGTLGEALPLRTTTGTATSGGLYNTGSVGDTDRSLGTLASGSTVPAFGLQLINTSGQTVDTLFLSGRMEQWRSGSSAEVAESVLFEYSLNAAGIGDLDALWNPLPSFDLPERLLESTTAGALDGNLPENQWTLDTRIDSLDWAEATTLTLRWTDSDAPSSDGLYALDDLLIRSSVTAVPEPSTTATLALGLGVLALRRRFSRRTRTRATPGAAG
jgi:hypothetical protein